MTEFRAQLEVDRIKATYDVDASMIACCYEGCSWHVIITDANVTIEQASKVVIALGGDVSNSHGFVAFCPAHHRRGAR